MTSPSISSQPLSQALPRVRDGLLRIGKPLLLFILTMLSTTAVGMRYMHNFRRGLPPLASDADILPLGWVVHHLRELPQGLPFSLTLVGILLAHEFGHYFACRRFHVRCTLPWMLPAPSLSGTFGAVIRLQSRIPSRVALVLIGAAGPIAGFIVALAAITIGLSLSTYTAEPLALNVQPPLALIFSHSLLHLFHAATPPLALIVPHPVLIASWMGLLITALNLLPAGQLDGGHILYALSPGIHRWTTRAVTLTLLVFGLFYWAGWMLWGVILLLPGMRHPRVSPEPPLPRTIMALAPVCLVILILCGTFQPFRGFDLITVFGLARH